MTLLDAIDKAVNDGMRYVKTAPDYRRKLITNLMQSPDATKDAEYDKTRQQIRVGEKIYWLSTGDLC